MIFEEIVRTNDKWASYSQDKIIEGSVVLIRGSYVYDVVLKNGIMIKGVGGPANLIINDNVLISASSGKTKKYSILQKSYGSSQKQQMVVRV